jgi:hypothetical protein
LAIRLDMRVAVRRSFEATATAVGSGIWAAIAFDFAYIVLTCRQGTLVNAAR